MNAGGDRKLELGRGLADTGKQDLVRRNAGCERAMQFAAGHHVGAGAELGKRLQHRLVGVRLHRIADDRLDIGEGVGKHAVVTFERRRRIAIERRAYRARQRAEVDRLGVQFAVAIIEVVHGAVKDRRRTD